MQIEQTATTDLIPYVSNSRTHSEGQVAQIAASIKEFGFNNPILVDKEKGIIAGHGRVMAAQKLNLEKVPTIELSHLSDTQRKAYIIADNKLALNAGWDIDVINLELESLKNLDFDISLIGFSESELEHISFGGWDSDIEDLGKQEENVDGIIASLTIKLDQKFKEEIEDVIRKYAEENNIGVEFT